MVRYIGIMLSALISSCDAKALLGWSLSDKTYFWREGEKSSQSWNTNNTHTHTHVDVLSAWRLKNTLQGGGGGVCRGVRWNARITQLLVCLLSDWVFLCAVVWTCRFTAGCLSCCSASEHDGAKKCAIGCTLTNSKDKEHFVSIFISESIHMETNQSDTILTRGRTMYRLNALLKVKLASRICVEATIAKCSLLLQ